jgi:diguanylate cyclase (GGDEF)-like protein
MSILDSFVEEHREAVARQLDNLLAMPRGATVPLEGRTVARDGQIRMLEGVARNLLEDENVRAIVVTLRDTTARRELEQQLERRAFQDGLTGLANRTLFVDRLQHALNRSARDLHVGIAVLFIDLDDFKAVNDGMGHSAGDEVIRGVAERIRSCVRLSDTVARLGGDEFTVLVEDTPSVTDVASLAQRLLGVLQLPIEVSGVSLSVPASVGVAIATKESTAESLLRDADIAMYSAKSQGKSRVTLFDETLRDVAVQRLALKVELPEALRSGQFTLAYQPIFNVHGRDLRGFEALIRWHHPQRGLVSPGEFIPVAEETGIIVDIGRWALEVACHQAVAWNRTWADPLSINVNVSALQLHQPEFIDDLRNILGSTRLPASLLTLELTESVLVKHQRVESILSELRAIGVGIAIDDFCTGYSSLSYLQHFPVTTIKVDQSFVADLTTGGEVGLVRSILSIGDSFGLTTVAEGVETAEQLELLDHLGCDRAQGFFLGRPQTSGEIDGMLEMARMARTAQWRQARKVSTA